MGSVGGGKKGDGDGPWDPEVEDGLQLHEVGEYADDGGGGGDHDDEPEVELRFGPHVFPFALEDADEDFVGHCGEGRMAVGGGMGGRRVGGRGARFVEAGGEMLGESCVGASCACAGWSRGTSPGRTSQGTVFARAAR